MRTVSPLSFTTTSRGVPAGANRPIQFVTEYPGNAASAMVGSSGAAGERDELVTASALSLPACTCGNTVGMVANNREVWPAIKSVMAGTLPLYGTCTMSTLAMDLNSSPDRWAAVPLPADA